MDFGHEQRLAAELGLTLEDIAIATYKSAVNTVSAMPSITLAASIQPMDIQHAAILSCVLGNYPVPGKGR